VADDRAVVLPEKHRKPRAGNYRYVVETWNAAGHRRSGPTVIDSNLKMHDYVDLVIDDLSCTHPPMGEPKLARGRVRVALEEDRTLFIEANWREPTPCQLRRR
jgi:hypothetical protein